MEKKMIRQRKFFLVLPVLALPFMTIFFWALGGGKMEASESKEVKKTGFNALLPDANLKEIKAMDKMSYYDKAKLDSVKFQELIKNDPNYQDMSMGAGSPDYAATGLGNYSGLNTSLNRRNSFNNPNEEKIYQKLAELNREMNKPAITNAAYSNVPNYSNGSVSSPMGTGDVDKLEQMMKMMNQSNGEDPEMRQLNGMLEKILDIQHPGRVQEKLNQSSKMKKGQVYPVTNKSLENVVSLLQSKPGANEKGNAFYALEDMGVSENVQNAIQAVIHENQTLVNGSTVKLRLVQDVQINGVIIPKDHFLFGVTALNGERLGIKIDNIRFGNSLFPVELTVYDLDGMDGIYIPGAITRDVAKQSAERSMQNIGMTSLDPSWEMQAAGAGIEAAKSLFSKKVKLIKVVVKAGYQVLLRDEKQKQSLTD
ncbi:MULTISPECIES: conjugative transposon protein TraM [unclassified Flavobacterium]|uniref:conjugative transposon protein TraM n=1 Tax=unclassified Flavobacterium TaxID=196869 RepID=UPI00086A5FF6|nr:MULTISPECIES: conjugative transposon protein TraM [unclassified Flavobacterium]MBN9284130.1 conjugative transposon protein TraM [Flavobacterium sp.]ODS83598.1 MAG: conjugative transposon protein TraM [Chryseobacterium sp. SCN 40-13]OJV71144.1 MAG: conjugative transposon protein TraM [Flavobacterium sp. 40-81]